MADNIVPFDTDLPAFLRRQSLNGTSTLDAATQGVTGQFAVVTTSGKTWLVKHQGNEMVLKDDRGQPTNYLDVVIVDVSPNVSRTFYKTAYRGRDAETRPPDCSSVDGITPDDGVPERQNPVCATCPQNVFGSIINPSGARAKACRSNRRLAIVPDLDIKNNAFGGPMLLRLPVMSLAGFSAYANLLKRKGVLQSYWVVTRIEFDQEYDYQRFRFHPMRFVTESEDAEIQELLADDSWRPMMSAAVPIDPEPESSDDIRDADVIPGAPPPSAKQATPVQSNIATLQVPPLPPGRPAPAQKISPFQQAVAARAPVNPAPAAPAPTTGRRRAAAAPPPPVAAPAELESAIEDLLDQPA